MKNVNRHINNVDYWQADILSAYDYSPFGVMLTGRTFEKEETVEVCHNETTLTTTPVLEEGFGSWFTWTTMGSALLTYVNGEMQVSNPSSSSNNIGASKTFTTGSGVHSVSFDIIDNTCATIVLWPPSVTPKTINVYIRDNANNVVASGSYTTAGTYNLSFTPPSSGLTYKIEFYMASASAFCYYRIDDVLITYQSEETTQVCEQVSKKGSYPRGFNGMLKDDEVKGAGNNYDYVHRFYDARLGRFLSIDDLTYKFPWYSPYQFAGNKVIRCIDLDGLEDLDMVVTSDPNTTTGEPSVAHLTISKDYTVVTSGFGAVPNSEKIIISEFSQLYSKGNVTLFVSELPSSAEDAVYLNDRNTNLARKALEGNEKARTKLKNIGVNYYVLTVTYNYTIAVNKDVTLCQAYDEMITNPARNGVVLMAMKSPSKDYERDLLSDPIYEQLGRGIKSGYTILGNDKDAGGAGLTASYNKFDFIFLNPNTWHNDNAFDTKQPGDPYNSKYYSRTEAVVHEAGHNSTDLGHKEGYNYTDIGLSSNKQGEVFPTEKNTRQIISSKRNRSNMTTSTSKPKY